MQQVQTRRRRRRKPTLTPRFGAASVAYEIGLIRLSLEMEKELDRDERSHRDNKK